MAGLSPSRAGSRGAHARGDADDRGAIHMGTQIGAPSGITRVYEHTLRVFKVVALAPLAALLYMWAARGGGAKAESESGGGGGASSESRAVRFARLPSGGSDWRASPQPHASHARLSHAHARVDESSGHLVLSARVVLDRTDIVALGSCLLLIWQWVSFAAALVLLAVSGLAYVARVRQRLSRAQHESVRLAFVVLSVYSLYGTVITSGAQWLFD